MSAGQSFPRFSRGGGSGSYDLRSSQSISSTIVDLACIAAVVYLAKVGVREPVVWSILSGLIMGRFGVAHAKTIERSSRWPDGWSGPPDGGGGGGGSGPRSWPQTPERDPTSFPRSPRAPREPPLPRVDPETSPTPDASIQTGLRTRASRARVRLTAWIERRRAHATNGGDGLAWWTRPSLRFPLTSVRVDAVSSIVVVVLLVSLVGIVGR